MKRTKPTLVASSKYPIEKGVPIIGIRKASKKRASKYEFANMEVGDSFFVPDFDASSLLQAARYYIASEKQWTKKFVARTVEGGSRIWRIS